MPNVTAKLHLRAADTAARFLARQSLVIVSTWYVRDGAVCRERKCAHHSCSRRATPFRRLCSHHLALNAQHARRARRAA